MPPTPASRSTAAPSAGFAVMPDMPSEPPHCSPTTISLTGTGSRSSRPTSPAISASTPSAFSTDLREPPASWMLKWRLADTTPRWP